MDDKVKVTELRGFFVDLRHADNEESINYDDDLGEIVSMSFIKHLGFIKVIYGKHGLVIYYFAGFTTLKVRQHIVYVKEIEKCLNNG